jgi:glycosyltransferase involved in cell wall biosynthesis
MTGVFDHYDSFTDYSHIRSRLLFDSGAAGGAAPEISIVIPTFRRVDLLLETLASVLAQQGDMQIEIVIVSNDEDAARNQEIVDRLPRDLRYPLRVFANDSNIGMFPNWNRGIELARGRWISVLNDDDVLRTDFVRMMMDRIHRNPAIDGLVCKTGFVDRRPADVRRTPSRSFARTVWNHVMRRRYDADGLRRIGPRQLFFGNELSNTLGFLFKREIAMSLGGFRNGDAPSGDYLFYARFGADYGLYLVDETLADVGVGENESLKLETMIGFMMQGDRLRRGMAGRYVPHSWLRMSPLIVATAISETNQFWHGHLDPAVVGRNLQLALPAPNRTKLNLLRLLHRAL